jgi:hypothetical protein
MINTLGPYLLILILQQHQSPGHAGLAIQEMPNFESCRAALVQLEVARELRGYCIAQTVRE